MMSASRMSSAEVATGGSGRRRLTDLGFAIALVSLFPLATLLVRATGTLPASFCAFRLALGRPCPLCGLTRAFAMVAEGRWAPAFTHNPLWPLAAGVVVVTAVLFALDAATRGRMARKFLEAIMRRWFITAAILLVFEVVRLSS